jgi:hypothetical protein
MPGIVSDDTELQARGRYIDGDKVRFRGGKPETIGGWSAFHADGVASGKARGAHAWNNLEGLPILAVATETAVYAWINGSRVTITPKWRDTWLNDCFTATSGSAVYTCTWKPYTVSTAGTASAQSHYLKVGDVVTFSNGKRTIGNRSMNISATITAVTATTFTFTHPTGTSNANVTTPAGDEILCSVTFRAGTLTGTAETETGRPRIYSLDNYGEDLVFCGSDGTPIWLWQPEVAYSELVTAGDMSTGNGWAQGGNWSISGGVATHGTGSTSNLSQAITGVLEGGRIYEMSFDTATYVTGILSIFIDSVAIFPPLTLAQITDDATKTWTFRFVCPAAPTNLIFTADTTYEGSIDNVTIKLVGIAHPVEEAPSKNYALFADANRILVALGSVEADGDFNQLLVRWCDQENIRDWVPDTDNLAGEYPLGKGSYLVGGRAVGERNIVLTENSAYTMTYNGSVGSVFSISPIADGCGLIGANAIASYSGKAFWVSRDALHMYDGGSVLAVECPVRDRLFGSLAQYQENKTFSWIDVAHGEWWIHYPHTSDGTEVSRYLTYAFLEKENPWAVGTFNRTIMTRSGTYAYPIGVDSSGNIWFHEYGTTFSGSGITLPYIETAYLTGEDGDAFVGARRYVPDFDNQTGNIKFTITFKRRPQGQLNTTTLGPFLVRDDQERVDFLGRGRQVKMKWQSVPTTTKWRMGVIGLELLMDQERQ